MAPEEIEKEVAKMVGAKEELIKDFGVEEYEYFTHLIEIDHIMKQMDIFDTNHILLKQDNIFKDEETSKSEITEDSLSEEVGDSMTFTDVRAKEINRMLYKKAQQPEIDIAFSIMSKNFLVEEVKKKTRREIYEKKNPGIERVLEEFAKMELTPNGQKAAFQLGFQAHLAQRPLVTNQLFETLDPTSSIPAEAKQALRDKLSEYTNEYERSVSSVVDMNEYLGKDSNLSQYESKVKLEQIEQEYKTWQA